jgi:hypothetical protein
MTDRLLTTREVCQRLGVCIRTLQVLRSNRKIGELYTLLPSPTKQGEYST